MAFRREHRSRDGPDRQAHERSEGLSQRGKSRAEQEEDRREGERDGEEGEKKEEGGRREVQADRSTAVPESQRGIGREELSILSEHGSSENVVSSQRH